MIARAAASLAWTKNWSAKARNIAETSPQMMRADAYGRVEIRQAKQALFDVRRRQRLP